MKLVVTINGREAIPVRAIPYVTGWLISPDVVGSYFSHNHSTGNFRDLSALNLLDDGSFAPMPPKMWDCNYNDLEALADKVNATNKSDRKWRRKSIPLLPSGVFVWKDDFVAAFERDYSPSKLYWIDERPGERDLDFNPPVPNELQSIVMEGFAACESKLKDLEMAPPAQQWGVIKREILAVNWPMPLNAPPLENILDNIPVWVEHACRKIGARGKGPAGSHLWNPAILAVCLSTKTPQKKWAAGESALTSFLRFYFPDYLKEWEVAVGNDDYSLVDK